MCCSPIQLLTNKPLRQELFKTIAPVTGLINQALWHAFFLCSVLHAHDMFFHVLDTTYERVWELQDNPNAYELNKNKLSRIADYTKSSQGVPFVIALILTA
jgi:hypothetical protein